MQILQDNALWICLRYRLADRVSEHRLHYEGKLQSPEQRHRHDQLLKLRYQQSRDVAIRPTRAAERNVSNIPSKCSSKFLNSPYYLGAQLWNGLSDDMKIDPMYKIYRDLNV